MKYTSETGFLYSSRLETDSVARNPVSRDIHIYGICCKCEVWVVEDLSLKKTSKRAPVKTDIEDGNLVYLPKGQAANSGLNKSLLDATYSIFANVIKYVAGKLGNNVRFIYSKGTSQYCWNCLKKRYKKWSY